MRVALLGSQPTAAPGTFQLSGRSWREFDDESAKLVASCDHSSSRRGRSSPGEQRTFVTSPTAGVHMATWVSVGRTMSLFARSGRRWATEVIGVRVKRLAVLVLVVWGMAAWCPVAIAVTSELCECELARGAGSSATGAWP